MGRFGINIVAQGGHGCQREVGDGEVVHGCGRINCPDCATREFVRQLTARGAVLESATFVHHPEEPEQVTDNLKTGARSGSFPERAQLKLRRKKLEKELSELHYAEQAEITAKAQK